jgi:hypothetical protein
VVPQQALALANSDLTLRVTKTLVREVAAGASADARSFARSAFEQVLARHPTAEELTVCGEFLAAKSKSLSPERAREDLILVLFNHSDFVTIR